LRHCCSQAEKATRAVLLDHFEHTNLKQSDVAHVTAGLAVLAGEQGFWEEAHRLLQEVASREGARVT
jgi:hypothetical protein